MKRETHNRPSIRFACELGSDRRGESQWPVWQPQQEPPRRISPWKNKSGGVRMNFTSSEEINPAQNSMTGFRLKKRFLWLGNNPERNGERRLTGLLLLWGIEEPHTGQIVFRVNRRWCEGSALRIGRTWLQRGKLQSGGKSGIECDDGAVIANLDTAKQVSDLMLQITEQLNE